MKIICCCGDGPQGPVKAQKEEELKSERY